MLVPPENLLAELRRLTDEAETLVVALADANEERRHELAVAWSVTSERLLEVSQAIVDEMKIMLGTP